MGTIVGATKEKASVGEEGEVKLAEEGEEKLAGMGEEQKGRGENWCDEVVLSNLENGWNVGSNLYTVIPA